MYGYSPGSPRRSAGPRAGRLGVERLDLDPGVGEPARIVGADDRGDRAVLVGGGHAVGFTGAGRRTSRHPGPRLDPVWVWPCRAGARGHPRTAPSSPHTSSHREAGSVAPTSGTRSGRSPKLRRGCAACPPARAPWTGRTACACCGLRAPRRACRTRPRRPSSMNTTVSATSRAKPDLVGDDDHRHAVAGQLAHRVEHVADELGVERRGRLVEQHQLGLAWPARGRSPRAAAGRRRARPGRRRACRRARPGRAAPRPALARLVARRRRSTRIGASVTFSSAVMCGNRLKCWNTIPISARLRATSRSWQLVQLAAGLAVADQLAVDRQPAGVDLLQVVDAAQERRLARARGPEQAHHLAAPDLEVDALQHLEAPEALVHALGLDHRLAHATRRLPPAPEPPRPHRHLLGAGNPRPNRRSMKYCPT